MIARERQGIADLEFRIIAIRSAIREANESTEVIVQGTNRRIADWLTWRREVAAGAGNFLNILQRRLAEVRKQASKNQLSVHQASDLGAEPDDVIVNINELELAQEIEMHEQILGELDGQLSLKNATVLLSIN